MLKTFLTPEPYVQQPFSSTWVNLEPKIQRNIESVLGYYRNIEKRVNNNHILTRIIKTLRNNTDISIEFYKELMDKDSFYKLNHFGITTYSNRGEYLYDEIHNDTINYIKLNNFNYNLFTVKDNWKDLVSLRVVSHDMYDVSMNHPDNNSSLGEIFYELDPVLMMLQYRYWSEERIKFDMSTDPSVFVYTYILTNCIPSYHDVSITNISLSFDSEIYYEPNHKFHIMDLVLSYKKLSMFINKRYLENRTSVKFETILNSIPLITERTALEFFSINNFSSRVNIKWFHYLTHIHIINDLLILDEDSAGNLNKSNLNFLKRGLKRDSRGSMFKVMDTGNVDKLLDLLERIK